MTAKILIIVESPSKCKKVEASIPNSKCMSSCGHIYGLIKGIEAIDISNNFTPKYQLLSDKRANINKIRSIKNTFKEIYLAMDPDREGEAIALHLAEELKIKKTAKRITFNEITKKAIENALKNPRKIDMDLCDAQKARRVLDRLMGFEISPLLWSYIPNEETSLSAGRCQSPALNLISLREKEITDFSSNNFYLISGKTINKYNNILEIKYPTRLKDLEISKEILINCLTAEFKIKSVQERHSNHSPKAPFTTSTLQQEASLKLGLSPKQTMSMAQKLYEQGLITYMRTDSTTLSGEAKKKIKDKILTKYGEEYFKNRNFNSKIKNAQEAHECIRVVNTDMETIDSNLKRLYNLIYNRTIASQMSDNKILHYDITVIASKKKKILYTFNAHLEKTIFDGHTILYPEKSNKIFNVKEGDLLTLEYLQCEEDSEKPKSRYTEASLVKLLEKSGIGRPSTFSNIITTLFDRKYIIKETKNSNKKIKSQIWFIDKSSDNVKEKTVQKNKTSDKGKLFLTETGRKVLTFLNNHFLNLLDKDLTSKIEEDLDLVSKGKLNWIDIVRKFYLSFNPKVMELKKSITIDNKDSKKMRFTKEIGKINEVTYGLIKSKYGMTFAMDNGNIKFAPICDKLFASGKRISLQQLKFIFSLPMKLYEKYLLCYGKYGFYIKVDDKQKGLIYDYSNGVLPTEKELEDLFNVKSSNKLFIKLGKYTIMEGKKGPYILFSGKTYLIPEYIEINNLDEDICNRIITDLN